MGDVRDLLDELSVHVTSAAVRASACISRAALAEFGFAKVSQLAPESVKQAVAHEVDVLLRRDGVRRDLSFAETDFTPRRMRNVRRAEIAARAGLIPSLYGALPLLDALASIAGEEVHVCPYEPEQYVITCLEESGDTHGWHWDDYSFALVWVADTPAAEHGGFVQCVPHAPWDKENPRVADAIARGPMHTLHLLPGDLYLMRTDTTLHRVHPITGGTRKIVNMAFAAARDLHRPPAAHETMDGLWGRDVDRAR